MSSLMHSFGRFVDFWWEPRDPRPLALTRILFAIALIANLLHLWGNRVELLYPGGFFEDLADTGYSGLSLLQFYRQPWLIDAMILMGLGASITVALGWHARLGLAFCYLFSISYIPLMRMSISGWDYLACTITFVLMFSRCDAVWSLSWWMKSKRAQAVDSSVPAFPIRVLQWQFLVLFVTTTWLKSPNHPWRDGIEAGHFLLGGYTNLHTTLLIQLPVLNVLLTHMTLLIELIIGFLLLHRRTRVLGFFCLITLMSIILTSRVYPYPLLIMAMSAVFLEGKDLDALIELRKSKPREWLSHFCHQIWSGVNAIFGRDVRRG